MANKTVALKLPSYSGTTGLTLILTAQDSGTIANGSGDTLTPGANGLFTCVVDEAITGWFDAAVLNGSVTVAEGGKLYIASDVVGTYVVDDPDAIADQIIAEVEGVVVLPVAGSVVSSVNGTTITVWVGSETLVTISTDSDLSAKTMRVAIETPGGTDVATIENASITKTSSTVAFTIPTTATTLVRDLRWSLRDTTSQVVYLYGVLQVLYAAKADS
jgi:hypothetical protein